MQEQPLAQPSLTPSSGGKHPKIIIVVIILALALLGGVIVYAVSQSNKKSEGNQGQQGQTEPAKTDASLYLTPSSTPVKEGEPFTVTVWVDTGSQSVNSVEVDLDYPTDKLDFQSISSEGSAFEIEAEASAGGGKITIARGQIGGVVGRHEVGKITFVPKVAEGEAAVNILDSSMVVNSVDNTNINGSVTGGTYTLGAKQQ